MATLLPSTDNQTQTPDNSSQAGDSVVRAQNTLQHAFTNYKSILQQHAQKSRLLIPTYEVSNEGSAHVPQFRATVLVGEKRYTSPNTFTQRKAAERGAAKFALDNIAPKVDDEELPNIREYSFFCKSILHEFAMKMDFDKPIYNTFQPDALLHAFKSVITFNGMSYTGEPGKNKKEAQQLAACAAILSILESERKNAISEIIKSKVKLYAKLIKVRDTSHSSTTNSPSGVSMVASTNNVIGSSQSSLATVSSAQAANPPYHDTGKGVLMTNDDGSPQSGLVQLSSAQVVNPLYHEFNKPAVQSSTVSIARPIAFVPPSVQQYVQYVQSCGQKRKRNNKKKAKKHAQVGAQAPVALMHPSQVPSCPMAQ